MGGWWRRIRGRLFNEKPLTIELDTGREMDNNEYQAKSEGNSMSFSMLIIYVFMYKDL